MANCEEAKRVSLENLAVIIMFLTVVICLTDGNQGLTNFISQAIFATFSIISHIINRPGVAGAVLQTPPSLID